MNKHFNKIITGCIFCLLIINTYARNNNTTESVSEFEGYTESTNLGKNHGIEVLNFYQSVEENNKYTTYTRFEYNEDYQLVELLLGRGYLELNKNWDFGYNVERELYFGQDFGSDTRDYYAWDNYFELTRDISGVNLFGKEWSTELDLYYDYDKADIPSEFGGSYEKNELGVELQMLTSADIGLGGSYLGYAARAAGISGTGRDGYLLGVDFLGVTNWGYGFQSFYTLGSDYYDYQIYDETYVLGAEIYNRWTHELSEHFAFMVGAGVNYDKFFKGTDLDYDFEVTFLASILYNQEIYPNLRLFGEVSLPGYRYSMTETDSAAFTNGGELSTSNSLSSSGLYFTATLGLEYIW